jgi:hypothetical protein
MDEKKHRRKQHQIVNGTEHKHCYICSMWRPLSSFYRHRGYWDGLRGSCIECSKKEIAAWRNKNVAHTKEYNRAWNKAHPEIMAATRARQKLLYPERVKRDHLKACRKRLATVAGSLHVRTANLMRVSLKRNKGGQTVESVLGYTCSDLKNWLHKTMPNGCTWVDFISGGLHIDHIIPVTAFNFTSPEDIDFKRCWALSNLRLLPARENIIKSNHLDRPFQPSLGLAVNYGG